ncbi:hypothetical protein [Nitrosococcus watsonii]|uniref:Uncharacterized protein n=1 Tax=Nitrosococcus watsoni (strain C-113) TaxID=105559 RepID=D8K6I3_NITWC|nr:hypothetical protein [Nitrosococcus watsonii]ADJ28510.1 hypothetical protein Nwat_1627 [Nitrosococcus watsonii C-113]
MIYRVLLFVLGFLCLPVAFLALYGLPMVPSLFGALISLERSVALGLRRRAYECLIYKALRGVFLTRGQHWQAKAAVV